MSRDIIFTEVVIHGSLSLSAIGGAKLNCIDIWSVFIDFALYYA